MSPFVLLSPPSPWHYEDMTLGIHSMTVWNVLDYHCPARVSTSCRPSVAAEHEWVQGSQTAGRDEAGQGPWVGWPGVPSPPQTPSCPPSRLDILLQGCGAVCGVVWPCLEYRVSLPPLSSRSSAFATTQHQARACLRLESSKDNQSKPQGKHHKKES